MLAGRTGLSPAMVGRSAEITQLASLVGLAGKPTVALISGEAGIGKTRLVQELIARVPRGTVVLAGQADPEKAGQPLNLLLDVLRSSAAEVGPAPAAELLDTARDPSQADDDRLDAAVRLIREVTGGGTGLVVFEDLHWADAESLRAFERLTDPGGEPLVLVGTFRPDGLSNRHPASSLLPRLNRRQVVTHLVLDRLHRADVATFLAEVYQRAPSVRIVKALHGRTGGNPFFLEELIASAATVPYEDLDTAPLPWTVAELLQNQVEDLDSEVRQIVNAVSVLGRRVPFDVLAAVTGRSEDELIPLLRTALAGGVLVETDTDYFGFRHELAREAVESGMLGRERRRLHETALETLRQAGSTDRVALAHHARGAGRHDDMVDEARAGARDSLDRGSSYQALQLAEMGLSEADDDLELLAVATEAAWLSGLLDDAAGYADRWLALARRAGEIVEEARALRLRIRAAFELADRDTMAALTDTLVGTIDRLPGEEARAHAMAFVAQSYMLRELVDPACEWADKAYALADTYGLEAVKVAAMVEKGSVLLAVPEGRDEGRELLEAAIADAERLDEHVLAGRALNNLAWHAPAWSTADEIRAMADRMRHHAKAGGWTGSWCGTQVVAHIAAMEGDLDAAIAQLDEDREVDNPYGPVTQPRVSWVQRAGLALESNDLETAADLIAMARETATVNGTTEVIGLDFHLACRQGRTDQARLLLPRLGDAIARQGFVHPALAHDLVSAGLAGGLDEAELVPVTTMVGWHVGHRLPAGEPWMQLIHAQVTEATGDHATAAELYVAAAGSLEGAQDLIAGHMGTAHTGAARNLAALGRTVEARDHARAAAQHLARWRGWRVDELEAVRRRLGLGGESTGPGALTPREREVAEQLAGGLTNSQLAEQLYISPRTAAVHVSNILTKLGMSSRTEVAAWVAGGGLAEAAGRSL